MRVPSPAAKKLNFKGIMAVSDDFGCLRFVIPKTESSSWYEILGNIPKIHPEYKVPYVEENDPDIFGIVTVKLPKNKKYWLNFAKTNRGKLVNVETTMRPYSFINSKERNQFGMSLDCSFIL